MIDTVSTLLPLTSGIAPKKAADPVEAGKQFETLFVQQILSQMPIAGMGKEGEQWMGIFREQLARELVDGGGFGLGAEIARELAGRSGAVSPHGMLTYRGSGTIGGAHETSGFGVRTDPIDGTRKKHSGVDIGAVLGTEIHAAQGGVVTFAGKNAGYGNLVIIDHGDGLETRYGHCSRLDVSEGQTVVAGQPIAAVGSTGRSTGPHLHFEVRTHGIAMDPHLWIERPQLLLEPIREDSGVGPIIAPGAP